MEDSFKIGLEIDKSQFEADLSSIGKKIDQTITNKKMSLDLDIDKINTQLKALDSKLKSVESKKIKMEIDAQTTDAQIKKIQDKINSLSAGKLQPGVDTAQAEADIVKLQKELAKWTSKKAKLELNVDEAETELASLTSQMAKIQDQKAKVQVEVDTTSIKNIEDVEVDVSVNVDEDDLSGVRKTLSDLHAQQVASLAQMKSAGKTGTDEYKKLEKAIEDSEAELSKLTNETKQLDNASKGLSLTDKLAKIGLVGQGIQTMSNSVNDITKPFVELDTATNKIKTLGGAAKDNAGAFREMSIEMSKKMPIGAEALQSGTYEALSAGISATKEDMQAFMDASGKLAIGGGETVANSVDILSSTLNAYGESAQKATEYSDTLFTTVNLGKTNIPELKASLSQVIPTAAAMGFSLKDVGASLALMTSNGIPTAQATTKLNALLIEIQKPGAELSKVLKKAGVSSEEMGKKIKSGDVMGAFKDLDGAMKKSGKSAAQVFSSSEAGAGFTVLTKDFNKLQQTMDGFKNSAGSTDAAYKEMSNSIENRTKQMKAKLDATLIEVADSAGPLGSTVMVATKSISEMSPMLTGLAGMKEIFGGMASSVLDFGKNILSKVVPSLFAQTAATAAATGAQTTLNASMAANPIGLIVAGVLLLGVALYALYTKSKPFKDFVDGTFSKVKEVFAGIVTAVEPLKKVFIAIGELIYKYFTAPFKVISAVFAEVMKKFDDGKQTVGGLGQSIAGLKPIFEKIANVASDVFRVIGKVFDGITSVIAKLAAGLVGGLIDAFRAVGNFIGEYVAPIFSGFYNNVLKPLIDGIAWAVNGVGEAISAISGVAADNLAESQKKVQDQLGAIKKAKASMYDLASKSYGSETWSETDLKNAQATLATLKKTILENKNVVTDTKQRAALVQEVAKNEKIINDNLAKGVIAAKQRTTTKTKTTTTNTTKTTAEVDEAAIKKAAEANRKAKLELEKSDELYATRLIANEKEKRIKILEINEKYDLLSAKQEEKTASEIAKIKNDYSQKINDVEEEFRKKDFTKSIQDANDLAKKTVESTDLVINNLKSKLDEGDTSVLSDFIQKSWEKLDATHLNAINDYIAKDELYLEKLNEISVKVMSKQMTPEEGMDSMTNFKQERIDALKLTDVEFKNLLTKQSEENIKLKKELGDEETSADILNRLKNSKTIAEYEKNKKLLDLKKSSDDEIKAAKGNQTLILNAKIKFWQESRKIEQQYIEETASIGLKTFRNIAKSLSGVFSNVKVSSNRESINQAKSDLVSIQKEIEELDKSYKDGATSRDEYDKKMSELMDRKRTATEQASQSYLNFASVVRSANEGIIASMTAMVDESMKKNSELFDQIQNNEQSISELKSKGTERTKEESDLLLTLTEQTEAKKQEMWINSGVVMGSVFVKAVAEGKSAYKALALASLSMLKAMLPGILTLILGQEFATKSIAGLITFGVMSGILQGMLSVAESAISEMNFAKGGQSFFNFGPGLHKTKKTVVIGNVAEVPGKPEFILNGDVTKRSDIDELNRINRSGMSPKEFYAKQLGTTYNNKNIIDVGLLHNDLVVLNETIKNTKLIEGTYNVNVNQTVQNILSTKTVNRKRY